MKYRCLTDEELKELEQEFKHFLISNNVYTEEWEKLNKKKDKRVQELVELFSDVVLDKALKNIKLENPYRITLSVEESFFFPNL